MMTKRQLAGFVSIDGKSVTVDPATVYPKYLEVLGGAMDRYWVTIAKRFLIADIKKLVPGVASIRIERRDEYALRNLPEMQEGMEPGESETRALKDWRRLYRRPSPKGNVVPLAQARERS